MWSSSALAFCVLLLWGLAGPWMGVCGSPLCAASLPSWRGCCLLLGLGLTSPLVDLYGFYLRLEAFPSHGLRCCRRSPRTMVRSCGLIRVWLLALDLWPRCCWGCRVWACLRSCSDPCLLHLNLCCLGLASVAVWLPRSGVPWTRLAAALGCLWWQLCDWTSHAWRSWASGFVGVVASGLPEVSSPFVVHAGSIGRPFGCSGVGRGVLVPVLAGLPCCMDVVQPALASLVACSSDCLMMGAWACSPGRQSLLVRHTLWSPSSPVSLLRGSFWLPSSLVVFCWLGGGVVHPAVGFEMRCLWMFFTSRSLLVRPREAFASPGGFAVGGSSSVVGGSW